MGKLKGLVPDVSELDYLREQFVEATSLHGRIADFYQLDHVKWKISDPEVLYKDPVKVSYTLDANPSIKTVSRYGWFSEDQESLPVLAYITYFDTENRPIQIEERCILDILSFVDVFGTKKVNKFVVQAVATDLELNQAVLNLVPYREDLKKEKQLETVSDTVLDHSYVKRKETYNKKLEG